RPPLPLRVRATRRRDRQLVATHAARRVASAALGRRSAVAAVSHGVPLGRAPSDGRGTLHAPQGPLSTASPPPLRPRRRGDGYGICHGRCHSSCSTNLL